MDASSLLLAALGITANVLCHFALNHGNLLRSPLRRMIGGFLLGLAVVGAALAWLPMPGGSAAPETAGFAIALYLMLSFCYFNFINLNMTSIRIRLLRELLAADAAGLPRSEVLERYGAQHVLHVRLQRLLQAGEVRRVGDGYVLAGSAVRRIAWLFDLLRLLVTGRPYGKPFERA
jgi:hypothetical protein